MRWATADWCNAWSGFSAPCEAQGARARTGVLAIIPRGGYVSLMRGLQRRVTRMQEAGSRAKTRPVPLNRLLLGGEGNWRGYRYAHATGELIRPSVLAIDGPHAQLLRDYATVGSRIFEKQVFEQTAYYRNARNCIRIFGDYFPYCWLPEDIEICARRFVLQYENKNVTDLPSAGHSPPGEIIRVFTVRESDCYEIDGGYHRVAFAIMRGDEWILAKVSDAPAYTPLQEMILRVAWQGSEREIYQPL